MCAHHGRTPTLRSARITPAAPLLRRTPGWWSRAYSALLAAASGLPLCRAGSAAVGGLGLGAYGSGHLWWRYSQKAGARGLGVLRGRDMVRPNGGRQPGHTWNGPHSSSSAASVRHVRFSGPTWSSLWPIVASAPRHRAHLQPVPGRFRCRRGACYVAGGGAAELLAVAGSCDGGGSGRGLRPLEVNGLLYPLPPPLPLTGFATSVAESPAGQPVLLHSLTGSTPYTPQHIATIAAATERQSQATSRSNVAAACMHGRRIMNHRPPT